ncbi:MAG: glyceraldehyde-3-phosphate dehydrogenase [Bacteroidetes bacterium]|nr:glyceraldehyde-3-phosphate dehydrogenase [Bacteroidota bacterium]
MDRIRLGLKGFGEIPRHLYRLCLDDDRIEVVAISDLGSPEILNYLISAETKGKFKAKLEGNFLVSENGKARFIAGGEPGSIPWDMFDVDVVVEGTWRFKSKADLEKHMESGANRVILTTLPADIIDRVVIQGINEQTISHTDKIVSAGSATTNASALMLKILAENFGVDYAMLTSIHSYTSDQPLRDRAGSDYRRSRSAAENIIPVDTIVPRWIEYVLPEMEGRIEGTLLNVPVPNGSVVDLTTVLKKSGVTKDEVIKAVAEKAKSMPNLIQVMEDPIVSSDVIDNSHSMIFDTQATMFSPGRMVKTLTWYHSAFAMANRIKELILAYHEADKKGGAQ